MKKMNKPIFKESFSVDEIHKFREYNYEKTKDFSSDELVDYINNEADKVRKIINKNKEEKVAI